MQMASSAKRTCSEWRSASLYTATVRMPSSLQAQMTRRAISPRFAIRIFWNMRERSTARQYSIFGTDQEQRLTVLHRLAVIHQPLHQFAAHIGFDLVHELHGFDDAQDLSHRDLVARFDEWRRARRRRFVEGPHNR